MLSTDKQTDKQTNRQTNQRYQKHNLLCQGGNYNDLLQNIINYNIGTWLELRDGPSYHAISPCYF